MPKYQMQREVEEWIEVEADSPQEAAQKAYEAELGEWTHSIKDEKLLNLDTNEFENEYEV